MGFCNLTGDAGPERAAIGKICADAGIDLKDCYQCGKCAAGCPVAGTADINCRQVIRDLQLGLLDEVLSARMPWLCLGCATCVTRCPQNVDMPSLNESICRYAVANNRVAVKAGQKFDDIFLDTVQAKGVNDEVAFAMKFNVSTGRFFQDVANSPRMFSRGLLAGDGYAPSDAAEVREMMKAIRSGRVPGESAEAANGAVPGRSASGVFPDGEGGDAR